MRERAGIRFRPKVYNMRQHQFFYRDVSQAFAHLLFQLSMIQLCV